MRSISVFISATALWLLLGAGPAFGDMTLYFECITNTVSSNAATGEKQLRVDVLDLGWDDDAEAIRVGFLFTNIGSSPSSICDVYFDDGTLLGIAEVLPSEGVSFSQPASPSNLPSGNNAVPPFVATQSFSVDSDPPTQPNGVNPGESLQIDFTLIDDAYMGDVETDLTPPDPPDPYHKLLRIGLHVQGFSGPLSEDSESFVSLPPGVKPTAAPAPASVVLGAAGLAAVAGLGFLARQRRRRLA